MKYRPWARFLLVEGVFFCGLGVGIWGSRSLGEAPLLPAAVFGLVGTLSLLAAGLLFGWPFRRPLPESVFSQPVGLTDTYRGLLRFGSQPALIESKSFRSEAFLVNKTALKLERGQDALLHHLQGPALFLHGPSGEKSSLSEQELLRLRGDEFTEREIRLSTDGNGSAQILLYRWSRAE